MRRQPLTELFEFAMHGSKASLQEYMLKALSEAANIEKRIREMENELGELRAASLLAELLLAHGEEILCAGSIFPSPDPRKNEALTVYGNTLTTLGETYHAGRKTAQGRKF